MVFDFHLVEVADHFKLAHSAVMIVLKLSNHELVVVVVDCWSSLPHLLYNHTSSVSVRGMQYLNIACNICMRYS